MHHATTKKADCFKCGKTFAYPKYDDDKQFSRSFEKIFGGGALVSVDLHTACSGCSDVLQNGSDALKAQLELFAKWRAEGGSRSFSFDVRRSQFTLDQSNARVTIVADTLQAAESAIEGLANLVDQFKKPAR